MQLEKAAVTIFILYFLQVSYSTFIGKQKSRGNKSFSFSDQAEKRQEDIDALNRSAFLTAPAAKTRIQVNDKKNIIDPLVKSRVNNEEKLLFKFFMNYAKTFDITKSQYSNQTRLKSTKESFIQRLLKFQYDLKSFNVDLVKTIFQLSSLPKKQKLQKLKRLNNSSSNIFTNLQFSSLLKQFFRDRDVILQSQKIENRILRQHLSRILGGSKLLEDPSAEEQATDLSADTNKVNSTAAPFTHISPRKLSPIFSRTPGSLPSVQGPPLVRRKRQNAGDSLEHGVSDGREITSLYLHKSGKILRIFPNGRVRGVESTETDNYCAIKISIDLNRQINDSWVVKLYGLKSQLYVAMGKDAKLYTTCDENDPNTDFIYQYIPHKKDRLKSVEHHFYLAFLASGNPSRRKISRQSSDSTKFMTIDLRNHNESGKVTEEFDDEPNLIERPRKFYGRSCGLSPATTSSKPVMTQQPVPVSSTKARHRRKKKKCRGRKSRRNKKCKKNRRKKRKCKKKDKRRKCRRNKKSRPRKQKRLRSSSHSNNNFKSDFSRGKSSTKSRSSKSTTHS